MYIHLRSKMTFWHTISVVLIEAQPKIQVYS
jgi:hypothetical protein